MSETPLTTSSKSCETKHKDWTCENVLFGSPLPAQMASVSLARLGESPCFFSKLSGGHISHKQTGASTCLLRAPEMANLIDAFDPAVHLLLCFGEQVENPRRGFHHEQVLPVEVPLDPQLPVRHLHLTLLQVDGPDRLFGVLALVVFQHVRIAAHAASSEHEPAFSPCLEDK